MKTYLAAILVTFGSVVLFSLSPPVIPDAKLTPGDIIPGVTATDVCKPGYSNGHDGHGGVRDVPEIVKAAVYREYGIPRKIHPQEEVDHSIALSCGGSNDIKNLWIEQFRINVNGLDEGAAVKDRLEDKLHFQVCAGAITLKQAQDMIRGDWRPAYLKYFGKFPPFKVN